jgi:hypothetical protein
MHFLLLFEVMGAAFGRPGFCAPPPETNVLFYGFCTAWNAGIAGCATGLALSTPGM